jgi:hypothetical protein
MGSGCKAVAGLCFCLCFCVCLAVVACEQARSPAPAAAAPQAKKTVPTPKRPKCLARGLGTLRAGALPTPKCGDDGPSCERDCAGGDAVACFVHALNLQDDPATHDKAGPVFEKACELGLAIGCTNHAADLWRSEKPADQRCAQKLFGKSCDAGETWGCGMLGRMLIDADDAGPDEVERGRTVLEDACDELGGFSCRVLALEMEKGKLGPHKKTKIRALLARACATHDDDSCGKPRSAAATFRPASRDP